jgi:tripartite-type tricarboxylate transporter receptor subunit TctC
LSDSWGQQIVVDNRTGIIGAELAAHATPDGYTVMVTTSSLTLRESVYQKLSINTLRDFVPVTQVVAQALVLVVNPAVPAKSVQELVALAKAKPGQLNYGSAGGGSPAHLASALFNMIAGINMQHVPYKGGGPALTALIGGEVQLYFAIPITTLPHIKSGRLKAIAIGSDARMPGLAQVPTFAESGMPDFDIRIWYGLLAPPAMPARLVERIAVDVARHLDDSDFRKRLSADAMTTLILNPAQFSTVMRADSTKYAKVIKGAKISVE